MDIPGLERRRENNKIYLQAKYYCLWRDLKSKVEGCDEVDAANPSTGGTVKKFGYRFEKVTGRAVKLEKYDTEKKYSQRYIGFKLELVNGSVTFVIDMQYPSAMLRRFVRIAHSIDWSMPFSLSVFPGDKREGSDKQDTGIWFQQNEATVKPYYTKENPNGMPEPKYDSIMKQWDYKDQERWLFGKLIAETIPAIEAADAKIKAAESAKKMHGALAMDRPTDHADEHDAQEHADEHDAQEHADEHDAQEPPDYSGPVTNSDLPFRCRPQRGGRDGKHETVFQVWPVQVSVGVLPTQRRWPMAISVNARNVPRLTCG